MPTISVVIATFWRYEVLRNTIRDLTQQTHPPHEIIVVDTTPVSDRQRVEGVTYIPSDKSVRNANKARNEGIRVATGDYVLLLDDDMELPSDCLEQFVAAHARGADAVKGAMVQRGSDLTTPESKDRPLVAVLRHRHGPERAQTMAISSCFTSVPRAALERIGLLDEAFAFSYDDWDLGYRLWKAGYITVHDPAVKGVHLRAQSGGGRALKQSERDRLAAKYYFFEKHFSKRAVRFELLTDILFALLDGKRSPVRAMKKCAGYVRAFRARTPTTDAT